MLIAQKIAEAFITLDEANADFYRQNLAAYLDALNDLDAALSDVITGGVRRTIIFGDRFPFRYLAYDYGLSYFAAFPGCSTDTEPSAQTVAFLIDKVRQENLPVVFHIELSNESIADTIVGETGTRKLLLHSAHNISKDDFENGVTYLSLMHRNVEALREALH